MLVLCWGNSVEAKKGESGEKSIEMGLIVYDH